jgi:SAM-dependent methyltransferase
MTTTDLAPTVDESVVEAFVGKVLADTAGFTTTLLAAIGDQLGLFKAMSSTGPLSARQLADLTQVDERYLREWLGGMTSATYIAYDASADHFSLPSENAPVLAEEGGPEFFGGTFQMLRGMSSVYDELVEVFRTGGGVRQEAYHPDMWDGMERFTAGWFENLLVQEWLPAMPEIRDLLEAGADVADVGCGRGRGLVKLAQEFPASRYVGFDVFPGAVDDARAVVGRAGVGDRVRIEQADGTADLPGSYDVVFTFDVVHDAVDPAGLLRQIRRALKPGGRFVCLDINASHHLEENVHPLGALFHGCSILYCMTTSLAHGGTGLGTVGFNEHVARTMCADAGFTSFRRVPIDNPFNNLYEASG